MTWPPSQICTWLAGSAAEAPFATTKPDGTPSNHPVHGPAQPVDLRTLKVPLGFRWTRTAFTAASTSVPWTVSAGAVIATSLPPRERSSTPIPTLATDPDTVPP
jgi:hypothetical protein